jgi:uncharacterized protein (DUF362 family)
MKTNASRHLFCRRDFLKQISLAGVGGLVLPRRILARWPDALSRVVIVEHSSATNGNTINGSVVNTMVDTGIMSLAQAGDVGSAWKALLPGVTSASTIAIKVNTLFPPLITHPVVAMAVANSLKEMKFGGTAFPENNIIIYDNWSDNLTDAGYTINTSGTGVRCFGTGDGWSPQIYDLAGRSQKLSNIVTDIADYIINLAVLKNHYITGVTLCLKNHIGTCAMSRDFQTYFHDSYGSPYIAALNALAPIKAKQKVNIINALFGAYSGGPTAVPQFAANTLIMSTDPVAADYQGKKLLIERGCQTAGIAYHIDVAATTYGLGTNDPAQMEIVTIVNPSTTVVDRTPVPSQVLLHQNYPNPFNPFTTIRYSIPHTAHVSLTVYTMTGQIVSRLVDRRQEAGHYEERFDGSGIPSGVYVYRLNAGGTDLSRKMVYLK